MTRFAAVIALAAVAALAALAPLSPTFADPRQQDVTATDFDTYVRNLWPQAERRGITRATFDLAFRGVTPDAAIIAASRKQAEYGRPVGAYVAGAVSPARLAGGRQMLAKWADTLAAAERQYGVDRAMLVAIWGMETSYGGHYGGKDIIRSLVTLATSGYREAFCREQLLQALAILQQGHIARDKMTGSWAGAMGQPQFIPSSFMRWAVDFSGDGRRDIWTNVPDVIGSIANYFRDNGWQPGLPWGFEVTVPRHFDFSKSRARFAEWRALGVRRAGGGALPEDGDAYLLFPAGAAGPAFLVTANFEAIKRYNISDAYALAVAHLADRLRGGQPFVTAWPKDDKQMSRADRIWLQRDLAARGFRVDNFVGQIDFVQRDAIRALQAKAGLRPDGHPTDDLLLWLAANPPADAGAAR